MAKLDIEAAKQKCRSFLKRTYGEETNERHYRAIPLRILVEEFLFEPHGVPAVDYKCYVFHGRCHYIWVHFGRFTEHTARFFDRDWRPLDVVLRFPLGPVVERPRNLERIIEIAEKLAEGFDFLRVDLYSTAGKPVGFGEITVTPVAGLERFGPNAQFDFELGALW
jgi:hypothetical protein